MNVSSILRRSLERELKTRYEVDLSHWSQLPAMELKLIDNRLIRILDECGSLDRLSRESPELYKLCCDPKRLQLVRTYLNYTYKVEVEPSKHQINETQNKFIERNQDCREWTRKHIATLGSVAHVRIGSVFTEPCALERILRVARFLAHKRLSCYRVPGRPNHGPGVASNSPASRIRKYEALGRDVPPSLVRFSEYLVPSPSFLPEFQPQGWPSECKLRAVPKDARGPRLIAPHSVTHMWMQQAVADRVCDLLVRQDRWFKYHPLANEMVSTIQFYDQSYNQLLALFGSSRPGMYATLDLSDASDRIPWSLVRAIMPSRLAKDLTAVRARYVLIDNVKHKLHMHAPMGSACCFPMLSFVVWSLACAAIWCTEHPCSLPGWETIPSEFESVFVFGDDVILSPSHVDTVVRCFSMCNLKVNVDKSYSGPGGFRESCGCDAWECAVITPLRLKTEGVSSVRELLTLVEHSNALEECGLPDTASVCRACIKDAAKRLGVLHLIGATVDRLYSNCLYSQSHSWCKTWNIDCGVQTRWNKKLQRHEIRVMQLRAGVSRSSFDVDGRSRLFEGVLGMRAPHEQGWAGNRPRLVVMWVPTWAPHK